MNIFRNVVDRVKDYQWQKYTQAFNFFQFKSISVILQSRKVQHAIHYRDMEFFDEQVEYFKRYYGQGESIIRVHKLINYYQNNMNTPSPNLIIIDSCSIMANRHKKIVKLQIMKQKSQVKKKKQEQIVEDFIEDQSILPLLQISNFSQLQSEKDQSFYSSYDSSVHDLFDENQNDYYRQQVNEEYELTQQILNIKTLKGSYLIIDFRRSIKTEHQIQKIQLKQKVIIQQNNSNIQQKKPQSFMQYYNSIQKKSTSNILQKYIKTKR